MSKKELLDAYQNGWIGRRAFVRSLVGMGVSVTAATAYASLLAPSSAMAGVRRGAPSRSDELYADDFYSDDLYEHELYT